CFLPRHIRMLDDERFGPQDALEHRRNRRPAAPVTALQHPHQLDEHHGRNEPLPLGGERFLDKPIGERSLRGIVLGEITDKNVRVETDHLPAPRFATIRRISSTETGRSGFGTMPLSERTSSTAGTRAKLPSFSSTNSTRSPVVTPSFCRTG